MRRPCLAAWRACAAMKRKRETAGTMGVSVSAVQREWRIARAWLLRELDARG